ncbi:sugar-binding domain-containing protein [Flavobacterium sp. 3HN19-14]|uniref:sugar-binding domain-containing protein n=1 Tax=Flavobacterium sp. 3HN19-14 TaxID=3448133 RepID=UPI003EDE9713
MIKTCICFIVLLSNLLSAQESLITNIYNREAFSLNGDWNYIIDPYENGYYNYRSEPYDQMENPGKSAFFSNAKVTNKSELLEYDFDKSPTLKVPGDWNTQDDKLFYYEGTIWYKKSFDYDLTDKTRRTFLYFGAVNYKAEVYLNGKKLGTHEGGFTPFNYEITSLLKGKDNFVVVKVDNQRHADAVPTLKTDWWNYGGITRGVQLVSVPANFISDYNLQLDPHKNDYATGFVQLNGANISGVNITVGLPET